MKRFGGILFKIFGVTAMAGIAYSVAMTHPPLPGEPNYNIYRLLSIVLAVVYGIVFVLAAIGADHLPDE